MNDCQYIIEDINLYNVVVAFVCYLCDGAEGELIKGNIMWYVKQYLDKNSKKKMISQYKNKDGIINVEYCLKVMQDIESKIKRDGGIEIFKVL